MDSNVNQQLDDLMDIVEGKQFDKWKVLENMFITYAKIEQLIEY